MGLLPANRKIHKKEYNCLQLHLRGKSVKEIAKITDVTDNTIDGHFARLQQKFNVSSKPELLATLGLTSAI